MVHKTLVHDLNLMNPIIVDWEYFMTSGKKTLSEGTN